MMTLVRLRSVLQPYDVCLFSVCCAPLKQTPDYLNALAAELDQLKQMEPKCNVDFFLNNFYY